MIADGTGEKFIMMAGYEMEQANNELMFGNGPVQLMSDVAAQMPGSGFNDGDPRVGLLIGDSQSDGGSTLGGYLPKEFAAAGLTLEVEAKYGKGLHSGKDYWDIKNPEGRIQKALARVKPSYVIVELGGNDSYWVGNGASANKKNTYKQTLETWVSVIKQSGAGIIWLGPSKATSVDDQGVAYDTLRQNVRNWQKEILSRLGTGTVQWFDTVPYTKDLEMQTDGVHFVGASYKAWAKALVAPGAPLAPVIAARSQGTV
jgi:lysophospholipase L1-like esterase